MLDIETSGLDIFRNYITSVAIVQFDYESGLILNRYHKAVYPLEGRSDDLGTILFRKEKKINEYEKSLEHVPCSKLVKELLNLIYIPTLRNKKIVKIFCNHKEFDYSFLQGYLSKFGAGNLGYYKNIHDINDLFLGAGKKKESLKKIVLESLKFKSTLDIYFKGETQPHNAFYDCVFQIHQLMACRYPERYRNT